jgi:hypothetical protein
MRVVRYAWVSALASTMSKQVKVCAVCMRSRILTLHDGTLARFCYSHRRVEPVHIFAGKQTRCRAALQQLKERRAALRAANELKGEPLTHNLTDSPATHNLMGSPAPAPDAPSPSPGRAAGDMPEAGVFPSRAGGARRGT